MTDRELLELAAKAAGYDLLVRDNWNPLTDDGDALRLAVRLEILINPYPADSRNRNIGRTITCSRLSPTASSFHQDHGADPMVATRRAIVRAAAEIGRAMA